MAALCTGSRAIKSYPRPGRRDVHHIMWSSWVHLPLLLSCDSTSSKSTIRPQSTFEDSRLKLGKEDRQRYVHVPLRDSVGVVKTLNVGAAFYRKGRKHTKADALSRQPRDAILYKQSRYQTRMSNLRQLQLDDELIGLFLSLRAKEDNLRPTKQEIQVMSPHARRLSQIWEQLTVHTMWLTDCGLLHRHYKGVDENSRHLQLLIPKCRRKKVLKDLHKGALGGHLGQEKTLGRLQEQFYWPGTTMTCEIGSTPAPNVHATQKTQPLKWQAPLQNIKVGSPMQLVAADILKLGSFP